MLDKISKLILKFIVTYNAIDANDENMMAFYKYGIELTLSSIINIFMILFLSMICDTWLEGIVFLAIFIPIRQFTGGYHADTYFRCNVVFSFCYLITLLATKLLFEHQNIVISIILCVTEILFISIACPIDNRHKTISNKKQYKRCKCISIFLYILCVISFAIVHQYSEYFGFYILCSLHVVIVLGILGIIKERRYKHEKTKTNC